MDRIHYPFSLFVPIPDVMLGTLETIVSAKLVGLNVCIAGDMWSFPDLLQPVAHDILRLRILLLAEDLI